MPNVLCQRDLVIRHMIYYMRYLIFNTMIKKTLHLTLHMSQNKYTIFFMVANLIGRWSMLDCGAERTAKNRKKLENRKEKKQLSKREFGGGCMKMMNMG